MLLRRWMLVPTLAASLALPLAGCTPETPKPTTTGSASATPLFASDEEALAAATKAYAAYLKMSDTISHDGGAHPGRIKKYATGDALNLALKSARQFRDADARSMGWTVYRDVRFQSRASEGSSVSFYTCEDVSAVDVVNSDNVSIVGANRPNLSAFLVTVASDDDVLKVEERETWPVDSVCS